MICRLLTEQLIDKAKKGMRSDSFLYGYIAAFAAGIALYFGLKTEPPLVIAASVCSVSGLLWGLIRQNKVAHFVFGVATCVVLGLTVAGIRAHQVAAPVLPKILRDTVVEGRVVSAVGAPDRQQVILKDVRIRGIPVSETPLYVRLNADFEYPVLSVGDRIRVTAFLAPPGLPAAPGSYDFARRIWFERIGATGRIGQVQSVVSAESHSLRAHIEDLRRFVSERLQTVLSYEQAQVAVPLVIGDQKVVSEEMYDLFRFSGITHMLSVSGFHFGLVAGGVFFLIRFLLAFFPWINGWLNTKKVAVVVALAAGFGYLILSGAQIPAVRAFVMLALAFGAVFWDRNPFSTRFAAVAAAVMLVVRPELILNIGFQLSFMAVFALVTLFPPLYRRFRSAGGFWGRIRDMVVALILVDVLATIATLPLTIYHFNQIALYGLLGNLATTFLFSVIIMPLLMIALLLMPIGGDTFFITMAGYGIDVVIGICRFICDLPGALFGVPSFGMTALIIMIVGLFLIFSGGLRVFAGLVTVGIGVVAACLTPRPIALAALKLSSVFPTDFAASGILGIRTAEGGLTVLVPRVLEYPMTAAVWLQQDGQLPTYLMPADVDRLPDQIHAGSVRLATDIAACRGADVSFVPFAEQGQMCTGVLVTAEALEKEGTHAFYKTESGFRIETARESVGRRLWHP